jgi:hypothetical protein
MMPFSDVCIVQMPAVMMVTLGLLEGSGSLEVQVQVKCTASSKLIPNPAAYRAFRPPQGAGAALWSPRATQKLGAPKSSSVDPVTVAPTSSLLSISCLSSIATMPVQQHVLNWLYSVLTSVRAPYPNIIDSLYSFTRDCPDIAPSQAP